MRTKLNSPALRCGRLSLASFLALSLLLLILESACGGRTPAEAKGPPEGTNAQSQVSAQGQESGAESVSPSNPGSATKPSEPLTTPPPATQASRKSQTASTSAKVQAAKVAPGPSSGTGAAVAGSAPASAPQAPQTAIATPDAATTAQAPSAQLSALEVPDPLIKTPGGVYASSVQVEIAVSLKDALLAWTLDGSEPGPNHGARYVGPLSIASTATLKVRAFIPGGKSSSVVAADFAVGELFVAAGAKGDGRRGSPLGGLAEGIAKAQSLGISLIEVAAGDYGESLNLSTTVRLRGGWKPDFSGASADRSRILGGPLASASRKSPAYGVKVSGGQAKPTIERFDFRGGEASYSAGIFVAEGAAPLFLDCLASGGSSSYGYGALVATSSAPLFRSCRLDGGGGATSYGLASDGASPTVESSILMAGNGTVGGYGLSSTNSTILAKNSVMAAREANVGYGAAFYDSKTSSLENCTIVGGSGKEANGVFISSSSPSILSCIIAAAGASKSVGVYSNYGESVPKLLSNTLFLGCSGGYYFEAATKTAYGSFSDDGRPANASGVTPARLQASRNGAAAFQLGAAPSFAAPKEAAGGRGATL